MPLLDQVFAFSNSPDFPLYQKWYGMQERIDTDPSLTLSKEEVAQLEFWPSIQAAFEHTLPEALSVLKSYESAFKAETEKYEKAVKDLEKQNKLFEFYKAVLDRLTKLYLDSLSGMLTEVYREVYETDSKQVQLQMVDFRNKKVIRLNVINKVNGKDYVEDFTNEGGAARVLLGIIVAIYFLLVVGGPRIIFLDESFGALHNTTLTKFLGILRQFVDQLGFVFVVIAHDAFRMKEYITKAYTIDDGVYKEVPSDALASFLESTAEVSQG